ncbi:MAG: hypothetical protein ACI4U2_02155 [Christensenellaceae bacterium]
MFSSTRKFIEGMDAKKIKYTYKGTNDSGKKDIVEVRYSGENMASIPVTFYFNEDCEDAAIRVFNICRVPQSKIAPILITVNKMNNKFRFAKFCFDPDDNTVQMEMDPVFRDRDVGPICLELLSRSVNICDDAYPEFMHAIY